MTVAQTIWQTRAQAGRVVMLLISNKLPEPVSFDAHTVKRLQQEVGSASTLIAGTARARSEPEQDRIGYYIGRETVIVDPRIGGMAPWRGGLLVSMRRNAAPTGGSFSIASDQVVEIGTEVRN